MSTGMNIDTGRAISGFDHVQQSLDIIMSTALKTRAMRRYFGGGLPRRVDTAMSQVTLIDFYADIANALKFEPRFKVSRLSIDGTTPGNAVITAIGTYFPRALAGDFTGGVSMKAAVGI